MTDPRGPHFYLERVDAQPRFDHAPEDDMPWSLFGDGTTPSRTAKYEITYSEFHPCVRPERRPSKRVTVKGHDAYKATAQAIRDSGGKIVNVKQRGR